MLKSLLLSLSLLSYPVGIEANESSFTDVSPRYAAAVSQLEINNIVTGKTPTRFGITDLVKRSEITKMIVLGAGMEITNEDVVIHTDVSPRFRKYVNTLATKGYLLVEGNQFNPDGEATRGFIGDIIWRYDREPGETKDEYFNRTGIILGYDDGRYMWNKSITRGEAAIVIHRLMIHENSKVVSSK